MKILHFDTETTGLIANSLRSLDKQPEITQWFGLMTDGDGNHLSELELFAKPKKRVPDEIIKKGIGPTNEFLADKPPFADIADQIEAQIKEADFCVAHNATFDRDMVNIEFRRLGRTVDWPELLCTVEQCEPIYGYRIRLGDLVKDLFDKTLSGAHDAACDTRALADCYFELKRKELI